MSINREQLEAQLGEIARRRKIAAQMSQAPERTQQAGGLVVPYSAGEGLAQLGQAWMARRTDRKLDEREKTARAGYAAGRKNVMDQAGAAADLTPDLADQMTQYGIDPGIMSVLHPKPTELSAGAELVDRSGNVIHRNPVEKAPPVDNAVEQVVGDDGQPTIVRRSDSIGRTPYHAPTASGAAAASMTEEAIQFAADTYRKTGKMPASFGRSPAAQAKIFDRIAKDASASGDTAAAIDARSAARTANAKALEQNTKLFASTSGYANTLDKNLDSLLASYAKVDSTGSPIINRAVRAWQQGVTGDPDVANMVVWLNAVQGEYAKLKSGSMGNAPASDSAMNDAKEVINKLMSQGGMEAVAAGMRAEKENRLAAIKEETDALTGQLGQSAPSARTASAALPEGVTEDDITETMRANGMTRDQVLERLRAGP